MGRGGGAVGGGGSSSICSIAVRRCSDVRHSLQWEALDDLPSKDERGPSSVSCTLELFQRQHWGKRLRNGVERIWTFPSALTPS